MNAVPNHSYRALVATRPELKDKVIGMVEPLLPARYCANLNDATRALAQEQFALVVCGFQFDDSRMFDLLNLVRAHPAMGEVPFIAIRVPSQVLTEAALLFSSKAAILLGASHCVDLETWEESDGEARAHLRFQHLIRDVLTPKAALAL